MAPTPRDDAGRPKPPQPPPDGLPPIPRDPETGLREPPPMPWGDRLYYALVALFVLGCLGLDLDAVESAAIRLREIEELEEEAERVVTEKSRAGAPYRPGGVLAWP